MPEGYFQMLGQELQVCGMGSPSPLEASWLFHLAPHPELPFHSNCLRHPLGSREGSVPLKKLFYFRLTKMRYGVCLMHAEQLPPPF